MHSICDGAHTFAFKTCSESPCHCPIAARLLTKREEYNDIVTITTMWAVILKLILRCFE